jgi:hypothetical protein
MNTWVYRLIMALLLANTAVGIYVLATTPKLIPLCVNGYVMVPSKDRTMYVQSAVFVAERCVPIDTD